ncbi:hypothetical protein CBR_g52148 [Chara braunii]|uniref:Uncharacterized protein n=1 Tax=Chara braunii TaxID=69332 RepID=A0A388M9V3_CHABU|nr:hypothetical protein CBR_g52148 [Chara braunii]|eukprot:GBG91263.1 hypothetical protein CBR_g52148 [Chara braunii]
MYNTYVPSAPPLSSTPPLPPPLPLPPQLSSQVSEPPLLQVPSSIGSTSNVPAASNVIVSAPSNAIVPYQPPRGVLGGTNARGWNRPREIGSDGEAMMILREMWNNRREEREKRREDEDRRVREEQARLAREEKERRAEAEEKKEADREARMTRLVHEQFEEMEAKKGGASGEISKKVWEKVEKTETSLKVDVNGKNSEGPDNRKRDQVTMSGNTPVPQQQRVDAEATQLDTGNGPRRRSSGISINEGASQDLGFDRINRGKKAVVAGPGKEGREKYIEDLIYELMLKTKHELEELCKKDRIKYVNKKITTAALAKLHAIDAYGEDEDDEDSEEDTQEENPS